MEGKEVTTSRKMTSEIIGGFFLYGIIFGLILNFGMNFFISLVDSRVLKAIINLIFIGISIFVVMFFSIKSSFKKRTIDSNDIPKVMKNLIIFTFIICAVSLVINFVDINKQVELFKNTFHVSLEDIKDEVNSIYVYLAILEIGQLIEFLAVLPVCKKLIIKYVEENV